MQIGVLRFGRLVLHRLRIGGLALAFIGTLLAASCGGSSGKGGVLSSAQGSSGQGSQDAVWLGLLNQIPDLPATRKNITMNDYAAARAVSKLPPLSQDASDADIKAYLTKLATPLMPAGFDITKFPPGLQTSGMNPANMVGLGYNSVVPAEFAKEFGYNVTNIDQDISAGQPLHIYSAMKGRFDTNRIDTAIDKDTSPFRALLQKTSYNGAQIYAWGDDDKSYPENHNTVRPGAKGGRLGVKGAFLHTATWTDGIKAMVDADQSKASLAQAADMKALVSVLSRYSFSTVTTNVAQTAKDQRADAEALKKVALKPYDSITTGVGHDDKGYFEVLILQQADPQSAQENVTRLKANIANGHSLYKSFAYKDRVKSADIVAEGNLLIARMYTTTPRFLQDAYENEDSLLVHE